MNTHMLYMHTCACACVCVRVLVCAYIIYVYIVRVRVRARGPIPNFCLLHAYKYVCVCPKGDFPLLGAKKFIRGRYARWRPLRYRPPLHIITYTYNICSGVP